MAGKDARCEPPCLNTFFFHSLTRTLQVELVVLLSISKSLADPPSPVITIELWKALPTQRTAEARERQAHKVWSADWTNNATPLYILLSDIFKGQVPPEYSDETDRIYLNTVAFRQHILDVW